LVGSLRRRVGFGLIAGLGRGLDAMPARRIRALGGGLNSGFRVGRAGGRLCRGRLVRSVRASLGQCLCAAVGLLGCGLLGRGRLAA
jgi:hypothetical protein